MKGIYRLNVDCGRMGDVEGIFVADSEDVKGIMGKEIYFGEVLGKHSEIVAEMNLSTIILLTDAKEAVDVVEQYDLSAGFNPFDFLGEDEEED